jgi:hypothetical protein
MKWEKVIINYIFQFWFPTSTALKSFHPNAHSTWFKILAAGVKSTAGPMSGGEGLVAAHGSILVVLPLKSLQKFPSKYCTTIHLSSALALQASYYGQVAYFC